MEIPTRHKRKLQHPTKKHCLWGGGKICNKQFIHLFLIDYGEIIHACSKAFCVKPRSLSLTRFLHGSLKFRTLVNYFSVIGQNKQINSVSAI